MSSLVRRTLVALAFAVALLAVRFASSYASSVPGNTLTVQRPLMGTVWKVSVVDHGRTEAARRAIDAVYNELSRIDALMSEWKPASAISQINEAAGKHAVAVPAELRALIERSIHYSEITQGSFDISWRGMANLWHFDDTFAVPSAEMVARARRNVGYRAIEVDGDRVFLPRAGMSLGLGGIAKGYAVDRAMDVLTRAGFTDALVDGGGDVRVSGTHDGKPWRLGIQDPREPHGNILGTVELGSGTGTPGHPNLVLVTSGDYERFRIVNGVRYHHIIDVRTGWPAWSSIAVTVLAANTEQGVVLAKGIFILGPEKGLELAKAEGVEALLIDSQGERHMTAGFAASLQMERE